jgi:hypothetical protein
VIGVAYLIQQVLALLPGRETGGKPKQRSRLPLPSKTGVSVKYSSQQWHMAIMTKKNNKRRTSGKHDCPHWISTGPRRIHHSFL